MTSFRGKMITCKVKQGTGRKHVVFLKELSEAGSEHFT